MTNCRTPGLAEYQTLTVKFVKRFSSPEAHVAKPYRTLTPRSSSPAMKLYLLLVNPNNERNSLELADAVTRNLHDPRHNPHPSITTRSNPRTTKILQHQTNSDQTPPVQVKSTTTNQFPQPQPHIYKTSNLTATLRQSQLFINACHLHNHNSPHRHNQNSKIPIPTHQQH